MFTCEQLDDEILAKIPELLDDSGKLQSFYPVNMLKRLGFEVILCSSVRSIGDTVFCPVQAAHASNVVGAAQKAAKEDIVGHCVTSWAVRILPPDMHELELALEPQARKNPEKPFDEILQTVGQEFFGVSPQGYYEAANKIATPFALAHSGGDRGTAIQWNHLKDSELPPANYALDLVQRWKEEGKYEAFKKESRQAAGPIAEGLAAMKIFAETVTTERGKRQVKQWLIAGDLQRRMNDISNEFFAWLDGESAQNEAEAVAQIEKLKADVIDWAKGWMTPRCAEHNAKLIFDHLTEAYRKSF